MIQARQFGKNLSIVGDCREAMRQLIACGLKVQMCVTSPPYWQLRDYGADGQLGQEDLHDCLGWATGNKCGECHICHMVEVFDLVYELLADDGTLWLNYGDSYASNGGVQRPQSGWAFQDRLRQSEVICKSPRTAGVGGLKPKDLAGMPWRLALALQASGLFLRQDIIWHKPNPMPESMRDRFTKAHEYIFLMAKSERYYFNQEAIKEPAVQSGRVRKDRVGGNKYVEGVKNSEGFIFKGSEKRNRRSVWSVPTSKFSGAHFATFPATLIEPCILAGSYPGSIVLDPFFGSGTTGEVAQKLGRFWVGIDINGSYMPFQEDRLSKSSLSMCN